MGTESEDLSNEIEGKTIIHWNYRGLTRLPDAVRKCASDINEIYLKDNRITKLPNWTNELVNLTHLYLRGNGIVVFPPEIAEMKNLTVLDLGENGLRELPNCIEKLVDLESLAVDNNCLKKMPDELRKLKNLKCIAIDNNEFVALPEWLGSLEKLEQLGADDNFLEELPNRLTLATRLSVMSVCSNRLSYLPLNGFASCPSIYFRYNAYLNYLSYPVYRQLIASIGAAGFSLGQSQSAKKYFNTKNLRISISRDNEVGHIFAELPRQLLIIHSVKISKPARLWELALRKIYFESESRDYEEDRMSLGVSYNLLTNGPIAVCVNENCKEPIFTEAWLIAGNCQRRNDSSNVPVVALYCSQNCARNFDSLPDEFETLRWQLVAHR